MKKKHTSRQKTFRFRFISFQFEAKQAADEEKEIKVKGVRSLYNQRHNHGE
jgi:hypothetical protein